MSDNVTTTREDVNVTVTESLNDSIFKSLSRLESRMNEVLLILENVWTHMPMDDLVNDGVKIDEVWEKQIRDAVATACRRARPYRGSNDSIIVDTVIAILKGHNED